MKLFGMTVTGPEAQRLQSMINDLRYGTIQAEWIPTGPNSTIPFDPNRFEVLQSPTGYKGEGLYSSMATRVDGWDIEVIKTVMNYFAVLSKDGKEYARADAHDIGDLSKLGSIWFKAMPQVRRRILGRSDKTL